MAELLYAAVLERVTGEQFDEDFDFDGIIPEGEDVDTKTVTATKADGTDATSDVIVSSSISTTVVTVTLSTEDVETAYLIKVAVTSDGTSTPAVLSKLLNVSSPGVYR